MEKIKYKEAIKTQLNQDFISSLQKFLYDWSISQEEARDLVEKYKKIKIDILAISKEELKSLAQALQIWDTSLNWVLNNLIKKSQGKSVWTKIEGDSWLKWGKQEMVSMEWNILLLKETDIIRYRSLLSSYKYALTDLQESMVENTDIIGRVGDNLIGTLKYFGWTERETGNEIYKKTFENILENAKQTWGKVIQGLEWKTLSQQQKIEIQDLQKEFEELFWQKFQKPSAFQVISNTDYIQYMKYWFYWVKWIWEWAWNWVEWAIKFLWKTIWILSAASLNSDARKQFLQDAEFILSQLTVENAKKAYEMMLEKLEEVWNLPWEQQAEAIWRITWEISIIFLWTNIIANAGRSVSRAWTQTISRWASNIFKGNIGTGTVQVVWGTAEKVWWAGTIVAAEFLWFTSSSKLATWVWKALDESAWLPTQIIDSQFNTVKFPWWIQAQGIFKNGELYSWSITHPNGDIQIVENWKNIKTEKMIVSDDGIFWVSSVENWKLLSWEQSEVLSLGVNLEVWSIWRIPDFSKASNRRELNWGQLLTREQKLQIIINHQERFNPSFELAKIKSLPKEQKSGAMKTFRQNFDYQQKILISIPDDIRKIVDNIDITWYELIDLQKMFDGVVSEISPKLAELTIEQRKIIITQLQQYLIKKQNVTHYAQEFANKPKDFFAKHEWIEANMIQWEVDFEVVWSNMVFYINPNDYNKIYDKWKSYALEWIWHFSKKSHLKNLNDSVIVISGKKWTPSTLATLAHELRHADNSLMMFENKPWFGKLMFDAFESNNLKKMIDLYIERHKDEILAYIKSGDDLFSTKQTLQKGGGYDYLLKVWIWENNELYKNLWKDYWNKLSWYIDVAYDLISKWVSLDTLSITPIDKWYRLQDIVQIKTLSKVESFSDGTFKWIKEFETGVSHEWIFNEKWDLISWMKKYYGIIEEWNFINGILNGNGVITSWRWTLRKWNFNNWQFIEWEMIFQSWLIVKWEFIGWKLHWTWEKIFSDGTVYKWKFDNGVFIEWKAIFPEGVTYKWKFEKWNLVEWEMIFSDGTIYKWKFLEWRLDWIWNIEYTDGIKLDWFFVNGEIFLWNIKFLDGNIVKIKHGQNIDDIISAYNIKKTLFINKDNLTQVEKKLWDWDFISWYVDESWKLIHWIYLKNNDEVIQYLNWFEISKWRVLIEEPDGNVNLNIWGVKIKVNWESISNSLLWSVNWKIIKLYPNDTITMIHDGWRIDVWLFSPDWELISWKMKLLNWQTYEWDFQNWILLNGKAYFDDTLKSVWETKIHWDIIGWKLNWTWKIEYSNGKIEEWQFLNGQLLEGYINFENGDIFAWIFNWNIFDWVKIYKNWWKEKWVFVNWELDMTTWYRIYSDGISENGTFMKWKLFEWTITYPEGEIKKVKNGKIMEEWKSFWLRVFDIEWKDPQKLIRELIQYYHPDKWNSEYSEIITQKLNLLKPQIKQENIEAIEDIKKLAINPEEFLREKWLISL